MESLREGFRRYDANERLWSYLCEEHPKVGPVTMLLNEGAYPDFSDAGFSTFQNAIASGNAQIVEILIEHGAKVNGKDPGMVPLVWAVSKGEPEVVRVLLKHGADINLRDVYGKSALQSAREAKTEASRNKDSRSVAQYEHVENLLIRAISK